MIEDDHDKYYLLSALVDDWLDDNDLTEHFFRKALKWAIRGLEEISLDVWQDVKTKLLTITDRQTITLPSDFVDWTKVAAKVGQYAVTLGVNDDLTGMKRDPGSSGVVSLLSENIPNGIDAGGYDFLNFNGGSIFGIGYGMNSKGYFKVHDTGTVKELLLDYDFRCNEVYTEYITNGFDPCGQTVVHPYLKDYILKYLDMKYEDKNNPKATINSKDVKAEDVFYAERKVRARRNDLDPRTILNLTRKNSRLSPKM